jgi:hypothetical protein
MLAGAQFFRSLRHLYQEIGSQREEKASMTFVNLKSGNGRSRPFAVAAVVAALSVWTLKAQILNPIQAAKDAVNKAKQQTKAGAQPSATGTSAAGNGTPAAANGTPAANNTANNNGALNPTPGTKIEATLLSPPLPGASFTISPLGIHMVTLTRSGSRQVVLYDNVEGPKFDRILGAMAFSPDGSRYAYCGQEGNDAVVMADGKEVFRSSETNVQGGIDGGTCGANLMRFSSNSKHLFFPSASRYNSTLVTRFVFDGQANPPGGPGNLADYSFSPDGDHYAYIWTDPAAGNRVTAQNEKLIIDGKPAPYLAGTLQWTADSKHLYSTARSSGAVDLLYDGKPIVRAIELRQVVAPAGDMTVQMIDKPNPPTRFLAVNSKPVPGSEILFGQGGGISNVVISADGKHYAAQYANASQQKWVFWDGKKGLTYRNLLAFKGREEREARYFDFTPDGRVIYLADDPSAGQYVVIGDKESDQLGANTEIVVSKTGHVMANSSGNATRGAGINLDGKFLQLPRANEAAYLGFSPDGNHYVFVLQMPDSNRTLYLDGAAQPNTVYIPNATNTAYAFSPDSKHLAYFYRTGNDLGVCVDGKCVSGGTDSNGNFFNLTFSADGNHLFWITNSPRAFRLFVDGKAVLESGAPSNLAFPPETWQTDGASGLILLTHDNEGYKRIRVTPSPQSSFATLR